MTKSGQGKSLAEMLKVKGTGIIFVSPRNGLIVCRDKPPVEVRSYPGVIGVLEASQETVQKLLSIDGKKEDKPVKAIPIAPGDVVIVIAGSYKGFAGIARKITLEGKILVHLSVYGKGVPVCLDPKDLRMEELGELWR